VTYTRAQLNLLQAIADQTVGAIVKVPGGAYPSYAQGYYKRDNAFYISWDKIARERETFLAWMKANVLEKGPEVFAQHAQRAKAA